MANRRSARVTKKRPGPPPRALRRAREAIVGCERCPRLRDYCRQVAIDKRRAFRNDTYWARPVPGFGDSRARVFILGLAPAAHGANRTGRVFTGDGHGGSGDFLMAALHRAGFASIPTSRDPNDGLLLRGVFIASAVRCAPPANKPTPEEIATCLPHVEAELAALPGLRVVVALGRLAFDAYLQTVKARGLTLRPKPRFAHGTLVQMANGITLVGCYHPSRQNTQTGRLTTPMIDQVFATVTRAFDPD